MLTKLKLGHLKYFTTTRWEEAGGVGLFCTNAWKNRLKLKFEVKKQNKPKRKRKLCSMMFEVQKQKNKGDTLVI